MSLNRLAREKSPYLLQHQHNPVDWFPWGGEAFEKARSEKKPIFLSIGYSTCHWCHVMERESFENEVIAAILNEHFVSIKVDREERPDVDRVYMTYVQATSGGGGWPMNVFLTPDLTPFAGGTYFPPEDRWGRLGLPSVLHRIAEAWDTDRTRLVAHGEKVIGALREATAPGTGAGSAGLEVLVSEHGASGAQALLGAACEHIARGFDPEEGGFSNAPKFPRPVTLNFLLRSPAESGGQPALNMALFTLRKMAAGGMYDHLGGGFHRYSVDRFWHIPHFEKMLYDQGQLVCAYLDAYQITHERQYAEVARDVLEYVRRDLTGPDGAFFSAEDADSPLPENPHEKGEGAFYVWEQREIEDALGLEAAELFKQFYGVEPRGNAPQGSDPQGEFVGKNTLIRRCTVEELAQATGQTPKEIAQSLQESRRVLERLRNRRPRPHLDDKIITAWNGLMISGFARAGQVFGEKAYRDAAESAARFLQKNLQRGGRLIRSYREGAGSVNGFADDYAFLIQGLLDLYEAGGRIAWLQWAADLQHTMDTLFWDRERGGYYSTAGDDPSILLRAREEYDGAEPAPNSVAALNTLRLGAMLDDAELRSRGEATIHAFLPQLERAPGALPQLLVALQFAISKPTQIVLAGSPDAAPGDPLDVSPLLSEIHANFRPNKVILLADGSEGQRWLGQRLKFIDTVAPVKGQAAAYLCENFECRPPITTRENLKLS